MKIQKRQISAFVAGLAGLGLIVGSWAYYTSTTQLDNRLKTQKYGDTLTEKFTPDNDWQPGEEVTKEAKVKNTGDYDLVVRVKLKEEWWRDANGDGSMDPGESLISFESNGNGGADRTKINYSAGATQGSATDGLLTGDQTVVKKTLANMGWTAGNDGYWYYNTKLAKGNETSAFMEKIMLAADADMGKYTTKQYWTENQLIAATEPDPSNIGTDSKTQWVLYTGAVPSPTVPTNSVYTRAISTLDPSAAGYAGAIYDLFITSETCQATSAAVMATWPGADPGVVAGWHLS